MGCCLSKKAKQSQHSSRSSTTKPHERRTPPLSSIEETVKEVVLSTETILPKNQENSKEEVSNIAKPGNAKIGQKGIQNSIKMGVFEAQSDTCERKEYNNEDSITCGDDSDVRHTVNRSPAKLLPGNVGPRRDRLVAKSPSRRFEQSPGGVNDMSGRMVQEREPGRISPGHRASPGRCDPGESSRRRSRSPATRVIEGPAGMNLGRTPSARRKTNRSPGRINRNSNPNLENNRKMAEESNAVESIENPLVSLECFIFL